MRWSLLALLLGPALSSPRLPLAPGGPDLYQAPRLPVAPGGPGQHPGEEGGPPPLLQPTLSCGPSLYLLLLVHSPPEHFR